MKRYITLFALLFIWAVTASAIAPIRISVATNTPTITGGVTIDVLSSSGGDLGITITKTVPTDASGILSFVLDGTGWTDLNYNKDNLVRVTFGGVVLCIERMEVIYAKQGLFGAMIEPGEINPSPTNNQVLTTNSSGVVIWATPTVGTVTGVSVVTANGVSGSSTAAPTPAITITLGAITPSSVAATGTVSGTTLTSTVATGTAPLVVTSTTAVANLNIEGNAGTATKATNLAGGLLGFIPYQNAIDGTALLAGNTSTTKMFLNQTGAAGVSAAPQWNALADADIPSTIARDAEVAAIYAPLASPTFTGTVSLNGGTNTVGILAPAGAFTSYSLTLPATVGAVNQVLVNDATTPGKLVWKDYTYAYCYDAVGGAVVAGADIALNSNEILSNITHTPGQAEITISTAGVYKIDFGINIINGAYSALAICIDGAVIESSRISLVSAIDNYNSSVILSLTAGKIITLRNASGVDINRPVVGVNTHIVITKIN